MRSYHSISESQPRRFEIRHASNQSLANHMPSNKISSGLYWGPQGWFRGIHLHRHSRSACGSHVESLSIFADCRCHIMLTCCCHIRWWLCIGGDILIWRGFARLEGCHANEVGKNSFATNIWWRRSLCRVQSMLISTNTLPSMLRASHLEDL